MTRVNKTTLARATASVKRSRWLLPGVALVVVACGAVLAASAPRTSPLAPIDYYEAKCARCHGSYGATMPKTIAELSDKELEHVVKQMASGPAQAPLSGAKLSAEVAYNRSLTDPKPFIAVTTATSKLLSGEVTPGSKVSLKCGARSLNASVNGHRWRLVPPKGCDLTKATLSARTSRGTTAIAIARQAWSHSGD